MPCECAFHGFMDGGGVSQVDEIDMNMLGKTNLRRLMTSEHGDVVARRRNGSDDGATSPGGATDHDEVFLRMRHVNHVERIRIAGQ